MLSLRFFGLLCFTCLLIAVSAKKWKKGKKTKSHGYYDDRINDFEERIAELEKGGQDGHDGHHEANAVHIVFHSMAEHQASHAGHAAAHTILVNLRNVDYYHGAHNHQDFAALCNFHHGADKDLSGGIFFSQKHGENELHMHVKIEYTGHVGEVVELYVHEYGVYSDDCSNAGNHFILAGEEADHAKVGELTMDGQGIAELMNNDTGYSLYGPNNILGRAILVTYKGDPIGCGTILHRDPDSEEEDMHDHDHDD